MAVKFFSDEWCEAARTAINNNEAVYQGFKDPTEFTHKMYLGLIDHPDMKTYLTFEQGKVTEWTTRPIHGDGPFDFALVARVEHFREAAEGVTDGAKLLMGGKLRIAEGNMQLAIQNAAAFNNILLTLGQVDTDWDI
jgi:putative sterol carrier protein